MHACMPYMLCVRGCARAYTPAYECLPVTKMFTP
jgi:hypothetical protein